MTAVLEADPELAGDLRGPPLSAATAAALAPVMALQVGETAFLIEQHDTHEHLGLLVLDGVIARHISFGEIGAIEFLGPGELFRPWPRRGNRRERIDVRWEVLAPAQLAVLDPDFAKRIRAWPQIHSALLERAAQRSDSHALQAALRQARRVEDRVLVALWHLAGRWGDTDEHGRSVKLINITGEVLARFVGARRQSVSTALGNLADAGLIKREADRTIFIPDQPLPLVAIEGGRRATDRAPRIQHRG